MLAVPLALALGASAHAQPTPPPKLALTDALIRAASADPNVAAGDARLLAAQAGLRQAGARLNPVIAGDLENFAGTGPYSLIDRVEATVAYEQTLERGDKRAARVDRARADIEVAELRTQVLRLDLLERVQTAYAEALAAEASLLIAEARLIAAQRSQDDIDRRVERARDPLFAGSRAEAATALAEINRDQAQVTARNARAALAAFWAGSPEFTLDLTDFMRTPPVGVAPGVAATPDIALLAAQRDLAIANIRVERSRAITDPTVRAGVRYLGDGNGIAFVVGGSIPLQRYDTNRGAIQRAQAERVAAEADIEAARSQREREIARLTARLAVSAAEAERIRAEVIPVAERTVTQVREGFNRGGFSYIDVTSAEQALADARAQRTAALKQYHLDRAQLDRLTGRHAPLVATATLNVESR